MTVGGGAQRLDKWLWCARLFRSRRSAAAFIEERSVRLIRGDQAQRVDKPGFSLKEGDEIAFIICDKLTIVRVRGFSARRGSAADAGALLERLDRR